MSMYTNLAAFQKIASTQTRTTTAALRVSNYSSLNSVFNTPAAAAAPTETPEQKKAAQLANEAADLANFTAKASLVMSLATFTGSQMLDAF